LICIEYEDIVPVLTIYSLLALVAHQLKAIKICSKAFVKLLSLPDLTLQDRKKFEDLGFSIFTMKNPIDYDWEILKCIHCGGKVLER